MEAELALRLQGALEQQLSHWLLEVCAWPGACLPTCVFDVWQDAAELHMGCVGVHAAQGAAAKLAPDWIMDEERPAGQII